MRQLQQPTSCGVRAVVVVYYYYYYYYLLMQLNSLFVVVYQQRQIEALKDLCIKAGLTDADIAACSATRMYRCK